MESKKQLEDLSIICLLWDVLHRLQVIHRFSNIEFEIFKGNFKLGLTIAAVNFRALDAGNFFEYVNLGVKHLLPLSVNFSEFIWLQPEHLRDYFKSLTQCALELSLGLLRFLDSVFRTIKLRSFEADMRVDSVHESLNQIVHRSDI